MNARFWTKQRAQSLVLGEYFEATQIERMEKGGQWAQKECSSLNVTTDVRTFGKGNLSRLATIQQRVAKLIPKNSGRPDLPHKLLKYFLKTYDINKGQVFWSRYSPSYATCAWMQEATVKYDRAHRFTEAKEQHKPQ